MTRKTTLGVLVVALFLITSGLSGVGGAATTDASEDAASSSALALNAEATNEMQDDNETTEANETTQDGETENATASITVEDQESNGSVVVVDETNLSAGGFVAVLVENGTVIGNSSYLEAGTHENVTVELDASISESQVLVAVAHMDTNDNQTFDFNATEAEEVGQMNATDRPYVEDGVPVSDVTFVTVGNETSQRTTEARRAAP